MVTAGKQEFRSGERESASDAVPADHSPGIAARRQRPCRTSEGYGHTVLMGPEGRRNSA